MARGQLRVYLGLAPGVGKTFKMLDEGWRRRERGADVVAALVETHQRPLTVAQLRDLEVVPRHRVEYRGAVLEEMDLEAVLARRPEVALVDELAHTNAPGSTNDKRWQDVETLLEAGIDVITTVNIQHLESVNDVVEKITGVVQRETVPDVVVRRAEQVELVDITPEALRRRMAHGNIYPADKIDASLSNFFRSGNLTALRELSLLWLADRVEDSLQDYLTAHDITATWETRERLVVGLTGGTTDEVLLRRAARMASRNHAEIVAVHVIDPGRDGDTDTSSARELVAEFEGTFHEIVDEDVARALVAFARNERATQIILGSTRRARSWRPRGGVVERVLRDVRDLDVHIIAVVTDRRPRRSRRRHASRLSSSRLLAAAGATGVVIALLTATMTHFRTVISLSTVFLAYLVIVLLAGVLGTWWVGAGAALAASVAENYYFVPPVHTFRIARPDDAVSIVAFLVFGVGASAMTSELRRRAAAAARARAEAALLSEAVAAVTASRDDLRPLLDTLRTVFTLEGVALAHREGSRFVVDVVSGRLVEKGEATVEFAVDEENVLWLEDPVLDNQDRQLVIAFAARLAVALQSQRLVAQAQQMKERVATDALRIGLLRSIAQEVQPSLDAMGRRVATLRRDAEGGTNSRRDAVDALSREIENLTAVVTNLLDSGRLDNKLVAPRQWRVALADVLGRAVASMQARGHHIEVEVSTALPSIVTDPELLERALVNVVATACRFSPAPGGVRVTAGVTRERVEVLVIDHGPGTRDPRRGLTAEDDELTTTAPGDNVALNVAAGFINLLGGEMRFEDTPGGGVTVALSFASPGLERLEGPDPEHLP